jgi:hypothetical protein
MGPPNTKWWMGRSLDICMYVAKIVFAISGLIQFVMPDMANTIFATYS